MYIYLDIETIPSQRPDARYLIARTIKAPGQYKKADSIAKWEIEEKPAAIEEAYLKTSFDGGLGQIVCASVALNDEAPRAIYRSDWHSDIAETVVLKSLFDWIHDATSVPSSRRPTFVGHNILDFDLRFIFQRAVVLGIKPPSVIPFNAKPWSEEIFDTMTAWGGRDRVSMDKLCHALSLDGKGDEIDGSKVWEFVQAGRIAEVAAYCSDDVRRTRFLHKRMTFAAAA